MKTLHLLLILAVVAMVVSSCKKEETDEVSVSMEDYYDQWILEPYTNGILNITADGIWYGVSNGQPPIVYTNVVITDDGISFTEELNNNSHYNYEGVIVMGNFSIRLPSHDVLELRVVSGVINGAVMDQSYWDQFEIGKYTRK